MKFKNLFITTIQLLITLILFGEEVSSDTDKTCANFGEQCNPYKEVACCDDDDVCKFVGDSFICQEKAKLRHTCNNNGDCSYIRHAFCSRNEKCICRPEYQEINRTTCAPLLGKFCLKNEKCAPENSICIDHKCQCSLGFIKVTERQCKLTLLGQPCTQNFDCQGLGFSECSNKICVCDSNSKVVNSTFCVPSLFSFCLENQDCDTNNSDCIDNQCQCKSNYVNNGAECLPKHLEEFCQKNSDCSEIGFAVCLNGKCSCGKNYMATNKTNCAPLLGGFCTSDNQCSVKNSRCIDRTCQCKKNDLKIRNNQCIKISPEKICSSNLDCLYKKNTECSKSNVCICKQYFTMDPNRQCVPIYRGFCSDDEDCVFTGFHCVNNTCQCGPNMILVSSRQCVKSAYVSSCSKNYECSDPWHAKCFENKCMCTSNHVAINNATCYPILGGYCWNNRQCITPNSECIDYHCQCSNGFIQLSDNFCAPRESFL